MTAISDGVAQYGGVEISDNKYYDFAGIEGESIMLQHWIEKHNNIWYAYEIEEDGNFKSVCDMIKNDNIMEYAFESLMFMEDKPLDIETFAQLENVGFDVDGSKFILSFKIEGEEAHETKLTIKDGKIIKVESNFYELEELDFSYYVTVSYNAEDVQRVDLPTNIIWTED